MDGLGSTTVPNMLSLNEFQFLLVMNEVTLLNEFEALDLHDTLVKTSVSRIPLDVVYLILLFLGAVDARSLHLFLSVDLPHSEILDPRTLLSPSCHS